VREDAERWDARYAGRVTGTPAPPKGLEGFGDLLAPDPEGVCLDIACGTGEQAIWAARLGYRVVALDVSSVAVAALQRAAREARLADAIDVRVVDLDDGIPGDVDGLCSLVICQRFRDPRLYPGLVESSRPGGLIAVTVLSTVGRTSEPTPFHAAPGELVSAFGALDVDIVRSVEAEGEATLLARRR
jgi:SAM-dependent methyltransferase